ncbi:pyruvate dehydrogenase (acetyl-transferring) E1 component subunit alpha, partial [Priestia megaterium]
LQEKDAIALFENYLLSEQVVTEQELRNIDGEVEKAVKRAVELAETSDYPDASELLTDVYVSY